MKNKFKMTMGERNWVLYDVGNSAFVLMMTALIPIYYNSVATAQGLSSDQITVMFATTVSVAALLVALINPILGAIADNKGMKKKMFFFFMAIASVACVAFGLTQVFGVNMNILLIAIAVAVIQLGLNGSVVFYDAMLVDVTTSTRMDKVSARGYGWGYIGSCIPFIICLALYILSAYGILPMDSNRAIALGMIITGIWWFTLSTPLLKSYKQMSGVDPQPKQVRNAIKKIAQTVKNAKEYKTCLLFVLAFFFYINGVNTIISMSITYATGVLGNDAIDSIMMVLALLMTQFVAYPFALLYGKLADKYNQRWLIMSAIVGYTLICIAGYFLNSVPFFFVIAFFVGLFQGGIQALSRAYYAKLVPKEKANELFGLFDLSGKGAAILGPALMGVATAITGNSRWGIVALIIFFIIGGIILANLPKNVADLPNGSYSEEQEGVC